METKRKLMVRDLGNPAEVMKIVDRVASTGAPVFLHPRRMVLGTIIGVVNKIKTAVNSTGDEVETLQGDFMGLGFNGEIIVKTVKVNAVETKMELRSDQLALPASWSHMVTGPFADGDETPIEFAIEVGVVRDANNTMGWNWALSVIQEPHAVMTLDRLQNLVMEQLARGGAPMAEAEPSTVNTDAAIAAVKKAKNNAA